MLGWQSAPGKAAPEKKAAGAGRTAASRTQAGDAGATKPAPRKRPTKKDE